MSTLSVTDRDAVIRTVYGEARNQGEKGMIAVAYVIKNRVADSRWPDTPEKVVKQKFQFSTWNENDPNADKIKRLPINDKFYILIGHIVDQVWQGVVADPTVGSVYYYSRFIKEPKWWPDATKESNGSIQIGDHRFAGKIQKAPAKVEVETKAPEVKAPAAVAAEAKPKKVTRRSPR